MESFLDIPSAKEKPEMKESQTQHNEHYDVLISGGGLQP